LRAREPDPWVIAHRGNSAAAPENTAPAFESALSAPIDGIELDVQMSADGALVIHHDATVAKLGGGRRRVSSLTHAQLLGLDAGGWMAKPFRGEKLLTLGDVLDRWGGRTWLLVEVKARPSDRDLDWHRRVAERTVEEVTRRGLESSVLLLSFDARVLRAGADTAAGVRTVWNLARIPRLTNATETTLASLYAVSVDVRALTRQFAQLAHERGKPVFVYTCNTPASVDRARAAGADAVMSDDPVFLARQLARSRSLTP
jgi:glycerophosphoryl diester phosphodiesterase